MIKPLAAATLIVLLTGYQGVAQTIYPIDRAAILAGSRFDFKVEFPDRIDPSKLKVTVNGEDHAAAFGQPATFVEREDGNDQSALTLRGVTLTRPGNVTVEVSDGARRRTVVWTVYDTGPRKAKNVILFIGDGLSPAHRVAARLLSKGIAEGKSLGKLAIDDMPHMALVATAGSDFDHHRFSERGERLRHRPQDRGQCHGRLCRPHRKPVRRPEGGDHYEPG